MRFITCFTILVFLVACQTALKKTFPILTISFVYLITYVWLFMLFKNVKTYFHTPDSFLFVILVSIGVLVEQMIFGAFYMIQSPAQGISLHAISVTVLQIILAGVTSPFLFIVLKKIFDVSDKLTFQNDQGVLKP